jgi:hypothetical protein
MMKKYYLCLILIGVVVLLAAPAFAGGAKVLVKDKGISSHKDDVKAAGAVPDISKSPSPGPGPVPIPYPKTRSASDTTKGSKKVEVGGKQIQLKNKSNYESSTGDEPSTDKKIKHAPSLKQKPVLRRQD